MTILEEKKQSIKLLMRRSGYLQKEIAIKLNKKPASLNSEIARAKKLETLEKIEKRIKEVI